MEMNVLINFHEDPMQNVACRVLTRENDDDASVFFIEGIFSKGFWATRFQATRFPYIQKKHLRSLCLT